MIATEVAAPRQALIVSPGQDLAGIGIRTKQALDRHPVGWTARQVRRTDTYISYPHDLPWRNGLIAGLYDAADVAHLNSNVRQYDALDGRQGKPAILHHHGTEFRNDHGYLAGQSRARGIRQVASTIDLTLLEPDVDWLPAPYNLAELRAIRVDRYRPGGRIRVAHAPTDRGIKSTDLILAVLEDLADRHPIETVLIERVSWRECLALKATADVFIDQLLLGYGCNSLEAWAMDIPVVAGAEDPDVLAAMRDRLGELPFHETTEATLAAELERVITSAELRAELAERGTAYVERWHDDGVVARLTAEHYAAAEPSRGSRQARSLPLTGRERRRLTRGTIGVQA